MTADVQGSGGSRVGGWRFGQFFALMGLTGFAISQPLLAVAGEDPSLFIFAGVRGVSLVVFALVVALVPPVLLWLAVLLVGLASHRAGDALFYGFAGVLAGAAVSQWVWSAGLEARWARGLIWAVVAVGFPLVLIRFRAVGLWVRYTAVLPVLSVLLLATASPAGNLITSPTSATASGTSDLPPVVFVMLDEFPLKSIITEDRSIDSERFPNLAAFAETATWYRDYTGMANGTLQAIPSSLTGQIPSTGVPLWTEYPDNLFSLLAPTHDLTVSETATQLCGFSNCGIEGARHQDEGGVPSVLSSMVGVWNERVGLRPSRGQDLGQFADDVVPLDPDEAKVRPSRKEGTARDVAARPGQVEDFIDALGTARPPALSYLHVMLPHQPWRLSPRGDPLKGLAVVDYGLDHIEPDAWDMAMLQQAHLFQAQYTDRLLGQILERLRAIDQFDESLIVVAADHGVGFDAQDFPNLRTLDRESIADIGYVPLLIKAPDQHKGRVDDSNLMAIDLLPTIASILDIDIPWKVDGHPAGSKQIDERGDTKKMYDFGNSFGREVEEVLKFKSVDHRPDADDRAVGPVEPGENPLAALFRPIGGDRWLGTDVTDVTARSSGRATLELGDSSRELTAGRLTGRVTAGPSQGVVALAVDGTIQALSPIQADGRISLFITPEVARAGADDLQLFEVRDDELLELRLS